MFVPLSVLFFSRSNRVQGILVLVLSLIPAAIVLGPASLSSYLPVLAAWGGLGIVLSEFLRREFSIGKTVFYTVLVIVAAAVCSIFFFVLQSGQDLHLLVENYVRQGVQEGLRVYSQSGLTPEQQKVLQKQAPEMIRTLYRLFPAILVIFSIFFVWINLMAARLLFAIKGESGTITADIGQWKLPDKMVWLVIAAGGMILIPMDSARIAGLNLIAIFLFVYLFQGLSVIHFFFEKKRVLLFFRGTCYALIFIQQILLLFVIILGFSDIWIDYRKLNRKEDLSADNGETH